MARTNTYLNFQGHTEAAFQFYRTVFQTEYAMGPQRMGDAPSMPGLPPLSEPEKAMVLHVELPIVGGHILMGTDAIESFGHKVVFGNNISINVEPDTREETKRLFVALADGGTVTMELQDMFWGAYAGAVTDRFGVQWMVNCAAKPGDE
jgi:PhnB protein